MQQLSIKTRVDIKTFNKLYKKLLIKKGVIDNYSTKKQYLDFFEIEDIESYDPPNIKTFGSICSGIGFQEEAAKIAFKDIELKFRSEINKSANKSFEILHGDVMNIGDFTKKDINEVPKVDLLFASTPCQDFSIGGLMKGFDGDKGNLTTELIKFLRGLKEVDKLPNYFCFENVKQILSDNFKIGFDSFIECLEELGYNVNYSLLNAKDYGIPQNRDRLFIVASLYGNFNYFFPLKLPLKFRIKDFINPENSVIVPRNSIVNFSKKKGDYLKRFNVLDGNIAFCLTTKGCYHAITNNFFLYDFQVKDLTYIDRNYSTLYCLSHKHYLKLMGLSDDKIELLCEKISSNQLYKQAGNGIVVDVLVQLFNNLKEGMNYE